MVNILVMEADAALRRSVCRCLQDNAYNTLEASDIAGAMARLDEAEVQLIIADNACGGCELTAELREAGVVTPVIILCERGTTAERRRTFRSRADGYMLPPIDLEELRMRTETLLWRCHVVENAVLRIGACELRASTLQLVSPRETIELRRMEFLLLQKLLSYPNRIFTRPQLMDELWGYDSQSVPRTVDTHIKRLRQKLKNVEDIRIQTVRGLGYRAAVATWPKGRDR